LGWILSPIHFVGALPQLGLSEMESRVNALTVNGD
jgi:hypothetical protein